MLMFSSLSLGRVPTPESRNPNSVCLAVVASLTILPSVVYSRQIPSSSIFFQFLLLSLPLSCLVVSILKSFADHKVRYSIKMEEEKPAVSPRGKRICIFLDGTWNKPETNTSVWRIRQLVARVGKDGTPQKCYYAKGVGTGTFDYLLGGFLALGLSEHIRDTYQWLIQNYDDDDEIFVFGFSRGSFMARSLVGLISTCGLLRRGSPVSVPQLYERYKKASCTGRAVSEQSLKELQEMERNGDISCFDREDKWVLKYSRRIPIKFVGVFDTVGALGLPFGTFEDISASQLGWHNTRLSARTENAYQALAIDENRKDFACTLYTMVAEGKGEGFSDLNPPTRDNFEQRWFCGAHGNVGGGYSNDPLPQLPLHWLLSKAEKAGLAIQQPIIVEDGDYKSAIADSYADFIGGFYCRIPFYGKRFWRELSEEPCLQPDGKIHLAINQTIDASVIRRFQADPTYRPENLMNWASRVGINLHKIRPQVLRVSDGCRFGKSNGSDAHAY